MENLYYVRNVGCDDETRGLVRISDEDFPKFESFIKNLNKNSTCRCMPTIDVYKITEDHICDFTDDDDDDDDADGFYLDDDYKLYLDDKVYRLRDPYCWYDDLERVI